METGTISLVVSGLVGFTTVLKFLFSLSARKQASEDRFAKTSAVENEFSNIKKDITTIEVKLEEHGSKINDLQVDSAVLNAQVAAQLREVEKLDDKLDEWRNND